MRRGAAGGRVVGLGSAAGRGVPQGLGRPLTGDSTSVARPSVASCAGASGRPTTVTVDYQKQVAKELIQMFEERKQEELAAKGSKVGWVSSAEITNGRWVMFGLLIGMLTEFATGVSFPDQISLLLSNLGIIDL